MVIILGGGLTGISTAVHLGAKVPWILLEKEARLGGHAKTDERAGFYFDKTGHWLHLRDDYVKRLAADLLPDGWSQVLRKARIFSHGVLTRYPFQANLQGLPPEVIRECLLGFIERPHDLEPRNFEDYCLKHFGSGISRHFMVPYNEKLWGVRLSEITPAWCDRFVPRPSLEQVVSGAVGAAPPEMGYNVSFQYPKHGGIETMTRALIARMVGGQVFLGTSPDRIDPEKKMIEVGGEQIAYRALVATLPLPELFARMTGLPSEIEEQAGRLRATSLQYLNIALRKTPAVDFHWIYVPEQQYPFYRVGIYTNAVPGNAPQGRGSLYVELSRRDAKGADEVLPEVIAGLRATGILDSPEDVLFAELRTLPYAYVVFDHHYYESTASLFAYLRPRGIYPCGRYGAWTYNSMEDCILAGRDVAQQLTAP